MEIGQVLMDGLQVAAGPGDHLLAVADGYLGGYVQAVPRLAPVLPEVDVGVNPVVIIETDELRKISAAPTKSETPEDWLVCLTEHKKKAYGKEIMDILNRPRPAKKRRRRHRRSGRDKAPQPAAKKEQKKTA